MIREINLNNSDILGLTKLMNQWDDLPNELTYDDIFNKVTEIKQRNEKSTILVALSNSEIVGYAYLAEVIFLGMESFVELQSILVDSDHRRNGIGGLLLKHSEIWTRKNGYKKLVLSSRVQLTQSHEFYKSMGYKIYKQSYFFSKDVTDSHESC
jgi:GNAT superfamily N-acetyltransferase